jgi:2-dehydro-3-deoxygluconokinase
MTTRTLAIRPKTSCRYDQVALGEVMLRLDPGDLRIATTRQFRCWEGGGEYNVARGLKRCFGLDAAIVTALVDNPVGRLIQDLIYQGGVDQSYLRWVADDGVGRTVRNGLNFTERGFGVRAAVGCSDRGHTAASQLAPGQIDWDRLFGGDGARWFHTGGIFAALSESTAAVAEEAIAAARRHGVVVSYDLNYRPSLWKSIGGQPRAQAVNRGLVASVDVLLGNEEDFTAALGFPVEAGGAGYTRLDAVAYRPMIEAVLREFPNLAVVATTLRVARSASVNEWSALCHSEGRLEQARPRADLAIFDRIGGGDSFASGLIYGFLTGRGAGWAVECGAAHGALAMTTPGDTTMATLAEVEKVMAGAAARVER